jgi:hypothetical protein
MKRARLASILLRVALAAAENDTYNIVNSNLREPRLTTQSPHKIESQSKTFNVVLHEELF